MLLDANSPLDFIGVLLGLTGFVGAVFAMVIGTGRLIYLITLRRGDINYVAAYTVIVTLALLGYAFMAFQYPLIAIVGLIAAPFAVAYFARRLADSARLTGGPTSRPADGAAETREAMGDGRAPTA